MYSIGIDIGGTKIAGALVDVNGELVKELRVPTPGTDPIALTKAVSELINVLSEGETVIGAGVAAAGFIDAEQANIIYAPNIAWRNEPFKANLEKLVKVRSFWRTTQMLPAGRSTATEQARVPSTWSC